MKYLKYINEAAYSKIPGRVSKDEIDWDGRKRDFFRYDKTHIEQLCKTYGIQNYTINDDNTVDVNGGVSIRRRGDLTKLPFNFGKVTGSFDVSVCGLTTLEGCPKEVGINFFCNDNNLTNLKGGPEKVGGNFNCYSSRLTSLEGAPKEIGGIFNCFDNKLTTLEGCPEEVVSINCGTGQLTSLKGGPKKVAMDFICYHNKLTTLEGCPEEVGGNFACDNNQLTTLKGGPKKVVESFNCSNNQLTSLEGGPKVGLFYSCVKNKLTSLKGVSDVKGELKFDDNDIKDFEYFPKCRNFTCVGNPIYNIWVLFQDQSKIEYFNYMDIIRDGTIIFSRLQEFLSDMDKDLIKGYKIEM